MCMAKRTVEYPDWAEKYRGKGRTIRKIKDGYGLYQCTSEYVKGGYPKSKQVYLGIITEKDGFIPKKTGGSAPAYIEYGFSEFLLQNFKRDIVRRVYKCSDYLLEAGIIRYIFGGTEEVCLRSSYRTYGHVEELIKYAAEVDEKRIIRVSTVVEELLQKRISDETDLRVLKQLLMLCVVEAGPNSVRKPAVSESVTELLTKYDLKMKM